MRSFLPFILLIISVLLCIGMVSAAEIFAEEIVCAPGEEKTVEIWLSETPTGLAGYIMTPIFKGDEIAIIQFTPSETFILSSVGEETMTASALDLYDALRVGEETILLGTLYVSALIAGESTVYFEITEITDDMGDPIEITHSDIKIQVQGENVPDTVVGLGTKP
jgi:hypothetical protein